MRTDERVGVQARSEPPEPYTMEPRACTSPVGVKAQTGAFRSRLPIHTAIRLPRASTRLATSEEAGPDRARDLERAPKSGPTKHQDPAADMLHRLLTHLLPLSRRVLALSPLLLVCAAVFLLGACRARAPEPARAAMPIDFTRPVAEQQRFAPTAAPSAPARLRPLDPLDPWPGYVARLAHPDFAVRSEAAGRLADAGASALDALGRAHPQPVAVAGGMEVSSTAPVLEAIMARANVPALARHLEHPAAGVRQMAAEALGHRGDLQATPHLIARLGDGDLRVRAAAASSLRRLTNRFFGFAAGADPRARNLAAARWSSWWREERGTALARGAAPAHGR